MASAFQRMALAAAGMSMLRESAIGLPMSRVSSNASSSAFASSKSAKAISTRLRWAGAWLAQTPLSKLRRAAATARSASALSQLAMCASWRPSTGLVHSKVSPDTLVQYWPSIKARPSMFRPWKSCSQCWRGAVVIVVLSGVTPCAGTSCIRGRKSTPRTRPSRFPCRRQKYRCSQG
ncbi:hypothetical protein D3C80_1270140 [compost metagenome]